MTALFPSVFRQVSLGRIPSLDLIVLMSFPLWLTIAVSDIAYKHLTIQLIVHEAGDMTYVAGAAQRLLQHALLYPLLTLGYWFALKHAFSPASPAHKIAVQLGIALGFSALVYPMLFAVVVLTDRVLPNAAAIVRHIEHHISQPFWLGTLIQYLFDYFCGLLLIVGTTLLIRLQNERAARAELDNQYLKTRLETLRGQLGRHFLSNSLNTVLALIHHDPEKAERAVIGLNHLLTTTSDVLPKYLVSVRRELGYVEHYLTIMRLRFEDVLDVDLSISQDALEVGIPDFLLVNLLENAFKHGGIGADGRMLVRLSARIEDQELVLEVDNSLPDVRVAVNSGAGAGLRNTTDRLSVLYGQRYRMRSELAPGSRWRVMIALPVRPGNAAAGVLAT